MDEYYKQLLSLLMEGSLLLELKNYFQLFPLFLISIYIWSKASWIRLIRRETGRDHFSSFIIPNPKNENNCRISFFFSFSSLVGWAIFFFMFILRWPLSITNKTFSKFKSIFQWTHRSDFFSFQLNQLFYLNMCRSIFWWFVICYWRSIFSTDTDSKSSLFLSQSYLFPWRIWNEIVFRCWCIDMRRIP